MKILYITVPFPYPSISGGRIRAFNILKYLAKKGNVSLLAVSGSDEYAFYSNRVKEYCESISFIDYEHFHYYRNDFDKNSWRNRVTDFMEFKAWDVQSYSSDEFKNTLLSINPYQYDIIFIRHYPLTQYFLSVKSLRCCLPKIVVDIDDLGIRSGEDCIKKMHYGYSKFRNYIDLLFLQRYYSKLKKINSCLVCSDIDRQYLIKFGISNVFTVPNVIDESTVTSASVNSSVTVNSASNILFCGSMSYPPNSQAMLFFINSILPTIKKEVPTAELTIVGKNAPQNVLNLERVAGVKVAGFADSLKPYYENATITIAPLLEGAGTRYKILEAMAHKKAVVSTSIGAEGLDVTNNRNIMIADDADDFAKACIELLKNKNKRKIIEEEGQGLVRDKYNFSSFAKQMDSCLSNFQTVSL